MSMKQDKGAVGASYRQSIDGCLEDAIGQHGLAPIELDRWLDPLASALTDLQEDYRSRRLPHLRIAKETPDLPMPRRPRAAVGGRRYHRFLRHRRLEPRRPDPGAARRMEHPGHGQRGAAAPAAHALLRQSRCRSRCSPRWPPSISPTRALSSPPSRAARPKHWCRRWRRWRPSKAAGLESRMPEMFLGITEPAVAGKANGLRTLLEAHGIPDPRPSSRHRRALLGLHQRRPAAGHGAWPRRTRRARRRPRRRCAR